jgi:hypothetical protein
MNMNALTEMQRGTYSALGEKLDWSYYDSLTLAAAGTEFSMFQVPIGGGATAKTLADTNMTTGGTLPQGQKFRVRAIRAEYLSHNQKATASIDLLYQFLRAVTVRFFITGKDAIFSKPLTEVMGIPMLFSVTPTAAGDNLLISSMGRFVGVNVLNVPITLASLTNFEVRINYPTALGATAIVGDILRISLAGILVRAS